MNQRLDMVQMASYRLIYGMQRMMRGSCLVIVCANQNSPCSPKYVYIFLYSFEYGKDDDVFIPDFASEYDYAILLPKKALEVGTYDQYCQMFGRFRLEVYPYQGINDVIVLLVRAPIG